MSKRELIVLLFISERVAIPSQLQFFAHRLVRLGLAVKVGKSGKHYRTTKRGEDLITEIMCECEDVSLSLALQVMLREKHECQTTPKAGKTKAAPSATKKLCDSSKKRGRQWGPSKR